MINLYSLKDVKVGFGDPFCYKNDMVAIRAISNVINDYSSKSILNTNTEDIELWKIAEFDEDTGSLVPSTHFIIKAIDLKKVDEN